MGNPHILAIPFPAQGHVIPLMELSQYLAKHGIRITFVNTEGIQKQVIDALATKDGIGNQIHLVSIQDGLESPEDRYQLEKHAESVLKLFPKKVEELIEQINATDSDKITCVVADLMHGWAMEIAAAKGIGRAAFCAAAATQLAIRSSIQKLIDNGIIDNDGTLIKEQMFQLSTTMSPMNTAHFAWISIGNKEVQKFFFENIVRDNRSINLSEWLLCNSTYDLEPGVFNLFPKIIPIGPLLASNRLGDTAGSFWPEDFTCLEWLDQQLQQSVIYVAFGSMTIFNQTQFQELAMGLELSNKPFLVVVRPDITKGINDAYLKGFQERITTRGYIVSWAPQQKVLEHPSIACFLSHCGWNSTMEGISNGVPFLCWPYFGDQMNNENYICNVWKVGLGFNRDERGIITREEIKTKVEELLNNEKCKTNALDLKERLMCSVREGGRSYNNLKHFVEWLKA
ncbi:hypothetical protein Patl1_21716 [Pistacia atlantica]|uniref:Uncharacterized protein n=1 Tax=Pistacia atlantica TaxID=434234 RepID=A0ACC1BJ47_9ROSI|nr:hypothetical protein Patl1_21716 [Pistacia atlantica]